MQGSVPPVMAFHLGSLGFLTPFKFESYKTEVAKVFEGKPRVFFATLTNICLNRFIPLHNSNVLLPAQGQN